MKVKEILFIILASLIVLCIFFYKSVLFQQIPFPGDLLVGLSPYKTQSYLGYAPGGYPNLAQGMDVITEMFPWKYFTIQELKAGRIPFWNPHNFSGNLHMQNYQTAVFNPFNVVFFLFSFAASWSLFIMLQPFLAMFFMYLFLRSLPLNKYASLLGSTAFAFSSYMTVWMEYGNIDATLLWLPLVLFALNKFIQKPKVHYFLLGVFSLTISFLAGYIQGVFYIYVVAVAYAVFMIQTNKILKNYTHLISLGLVFFLPILLSAFQLLPSYSLFNTSTRSSYSLSQISHLLQPLDM